jgi:glyoxylase-like metal-dependent hydrolase (beta-lactamase superfamily II)
VCAELGVPLWCGADDAAAVEAGKMVAKGGRMVPAAKAQHVERRLTEGDEVAGFVVLDTPGHSPGHVSYWRESDRTLLCGDVLWGYNPFTMMGGPREPYGFVSPDPALNRASARRLAELEPALVCFGHGKPLRDPAKFAAVVAKLG